MGKTEEINLKVNSDIKSVTKDAEGLAGEFKVMGISLNGVKATMGRIIPTARAMFGTIKAGIASTGIGLLVIAFGSLVQYFKDSEEGASKFKQITSQLGVVVGNVTDIVSNLGKAVFKLITGDFSGFKDALGEVTDGVKDFGETTRKEMKQANQLEKDRLALQKFEREAIVDKAKTEKEMMELRLKARDFEKFAAEERLGFMREANKLAGEQLAKDLFVAEEKLRFQIEENSYSKSTQQNLDDEAALQAAVFNIEKQNFSERKRLKSEEQAIVKEIQAANKAVLKATQDDEDAAFKKKVADNDAWNKEQQKSRKENTAADTKVADDKKALEDSLLQMKIGFAQKGLSAIEQIAGEGTKVAKAAAIARATISGVESVQNAFKTAQDSPITALFPGYPFVQAGLAGAFSAIQLQKIISGGAVDASSGDGTSSMSSMTGRISTIDPEMPSSQMMSGAFQLTGGQKVEPTRAYVVSDDITANQNALEIIRRRATI